MQGFVRSGREEEEIEWKIDYPAVYTPLDKPQRTLASVSDGEIDRIKQAFLLTDQYLDSYMRLMYGVLTKSLYTGSRGIMGVLKL